MAIAGYYSSRGLGLCFKKNKTIFQQVLHFCNFSCNFWVRAGVRVVGGSDISLKLHQHCLTADNLHHVRSGPAPVVARGMGEKERAGDLDES